MLKKLFILSLIFTYVGVSKAQDAQIFKPDSIQRELKATRINTHLKVDGKLDESEWKQVRASSDFVQIEPLQGEKPSQNTYIRVLYNKQFLYFGIFAADSLGKKSIRATDFKRDFNFRQHDLIALSFDGFNDKRNAMALVTNPYGVQRDLLAFDDIYFDVDWDGLWRVRTSRTDSGWVAEMAVPWQTLRYPKSADSLQSWGFNVFRNRRLSNEQSAFSAFPRVFSNLRMDYAGKLTHLQAPPPGTNIRIQPYLLSSYDSYSSPDLSSKDTKLKFGGELKWAINSNAILDLTSNTDFAQADADRQVNNVTRFSVFFPERRQFFLENASLFGVGVGPSEDFSGGFMRVQPFFSRRIGLDDSGNPIPIDAGGRFVYRSSKQNFGLIAMRQRGRDETPATNFLVGRYSKNFGEQNRIGTLLTLKNRPDGSNIVGAVDGFFRFKQFHSLNSMLVYSKSTGSGKQGFSGMTQYTFTNNQMKIWLTQSVVTKDFNPEMGFVSRTDVIGTTPGIFYFNRGKWLPKKYIRAYEPGIMTEFYHQASTGKLIERQLNFGPLWFNFQNGGFLGYMVNPTYQGLTEVFEPLGLVIAPGNYNYIRHQLYASSDPSKMLNFVLDFNWGTYFDGKLIANDLKVQFAPIPNISIIGQFNRNYFKSVGVNNETKAVDLYSLEARLALNPRVQLISFYQRNSENQSQNYNVRLSWEYKPLSYLYLVFNRRGFNANTRPNYARELQTENHLIAKLSYLKQF